ncbi:MAG TPA: ABC transporter permease [Candidatus Acidoferrales bacterium]|nr:ABC transporter permease [Candidatus Acidoferrales bacterium]
MGDFLQDVKYALRVLRKNLLLTTVIVASLAIGIGANSAVFSVVDALLLHPLPYPNANRLVAIWLHSPAIGIFRDWPSPGQFMDLQTQNSSFDTMALSQSRTYILTGREQPERVDVLSTQSAGLEMFGARPILGRSLLPEDDKPGSPSVAILTYRVWQRLFSSDPEIVGKSIILNGTPHVVAGVLQSSFLLNSEVMPSEGPMDKMDIVLPLQLDAKAWARRGDENYNIVARLKPGVTTQQAQADVSIIAARIREKDKRGSSFGMHVIGLQEQVVGDVRRSLLVLMGSVALVLLIACANVANLLLSRAAGREKEVAIRTALGAGWRRLARQLLTESGLLGLLGGAAGLLVARASISAVHALNPGNIPRLDDIQINGSVLAFTFIVSILTGILFGLAPVIRGIAIDLNTSLKAGGRGGQTDGGLYIKRHRLRGLLIVSELTLSLMLLIGAGLLIRSFIRLQNVPPGFSTNSVISMQVAATDPKYRDPKAASNLWRDIDLRVSHLPGVVAEGESDVLPLTGAVGWGGMSVEGYNPPPGQELQVDQRVASADYFQTLQIPLRRGRFFAEQDTPDSQPVVLIDEKFAQRFWPDTDPVGHHVWFDPKKPYTIAGVVGGVKQYGLDTEGKIVVYFPQSQNPDRSMFLVARTSTDPEAMSSSIVGAVHAVDPGIAVYGIQTMQQRLYNSLARQRFASTMLGAFAVFALLLAAVGLYGVLSHLVSQSSHDIGVMVTLGAEPSHIVRLVVQQGMSLVVTGIVAGLAGAFALSRVMSGLLFGISARDFATFFSVPLILACIAFAASIIPAWRASRVDPIVALRDE